MTDHHGVFVALRPVDRGKYRAHVGAWREVVEYFSVPRQSRCRFARAQRGAANHAIVGGQVPAQPRCGGVGLLAAAAREGRCRSALREMLRASGRSSASAWRHRIRFMSGQGLRRALSMVTCDGRRKAKRQKTKRAIQWVQPMDSPSVSALAMSSA